MSAVATASTPRRRLDTDRLILLVLALGFVMTAVEVRYLHRGVVGERATAWIPTIASSIGALASLIGMAGRRAQVLAMALFVAVAGAGLVGLYLHTELKPSAFSALLQSGSTTVQSSQSEDDFEQFDKTAESEGTPPALAPLSVTGLATVGGLAVLSLLLTSRRRNQLAA